MLKRLHFKFGPHPNAAPVSFEPGPMTVLVGPNNSGKSLALRELHGLVKRAKAHEAKNLVISGLEPYFPPNGPLREAVSQEIARDIEPLRKTLGGSVNTAVAVFAPVAEAEEWVRAAQVVSLIERAGRLKDLSKSDKINIDRLRASLAPPERKRDESDIHYLLRLGHALLDGVEAHVDVIELLSSPANAETPVSALVEGGFVRLDGYMEAFRELSALFDGKGRLGLVDPQRTHHLGTKAENLPMAIRGDHKTRERLRDYVFAAFGKYLVVDVSSMRDARFALADRPPEALEDSIGPEAVAYYSSALDISTFSDGVKSYVGLHAALLAGDHKLILIDEPEAFLHPPLARRLGYNLTKLAVERGASIVAATHSPAFLMGCVEAGEPLNVVRLGYQNGQGRARLLPATQLANMMKSPLLRSTGVLETLFHQSAVICEGDSDRAFYQEVYERLQRDRHENTSAGPAPFRATRDCIFLNSHGTGSIPDLLDALHRVGIPTAAILDLDLLKDRKPSVADFLKAVGADESEYRSINNDRGEKYKAFEKIARDSDPQEADPQKIKDATSRLIKRGGILNLKDDKQRLAIQTFLDRLAVYGLFAVQVGELESWLPELGKGINKQDWVPEMFKKMGIPGAEDYLAPGKGDVWEFIQQVTDWLEKQANAVPSSSTT